MANVFGILTAIVLAIAAFIAYKNKGAYETEIANRTTAQDQLEASNTRLEGAKSDLTAAQQQLEETLAEVERSKTQQTEQEAANVALSESIEAKRPELEANKARLDGIRERTPNIGNINDLAARLRTLLAENEELAQTLATTNASLANVTSENISVEATVAEQKRQVELLAKGESFPTLNTRIRSIYPNWGFVTLADGDNAGVVTNSTLDVVRNGEPIGKLLVTAVESNSSSASIIPDTVAEGVTLSPGDQVVPGQRAAN